jgi:hypothetical protein
VIRTLSPMGREYKSDDPAKASCIRRQVREEIVKALKGIGELGLQFKSRYGIAVRMSADVKRQCVEDFTGDTLDSVLCAVQAAWAARNRASGFGVPKSPASAEGWICDPGIQQPSGESSTITRAGAADRKTP